MPEYIIKDVALNELGELFTICSESLPNENGHHYVTEKELLIGYDHLCNIPPADVVPVVRCKDCKHYKTKYCTMDIWHEDITIYRAKPDDFCSRGELKEQNDDATTD